MSKEHQTRQEALARQVKENLRLALRSEVSEPVPEKMKQMLDLLQRRLSG